MLRRPSGSTAGTVLWAAGVAASPLVATLGAPLDRAGRVARRARPVDSRPSRGVRGRRRGGVSAPGTASCCPASRRPRCRARRMRRRTSCGACAASRPRRSSTSNLGNMAIVGRGVRRRRPGLDPRFRASSAGSRGFPAHRDADRLPQPPRRALRVGGRLPHLSAQRAADHRGRHRSRST